MVHEPASDVLPEASDMLPEKPAAEVVELPVRARAPHRTPATVSITKTSLRRLVCPVDKAETFYWDDQLPGLGLRAYASGKRVWLLQYRDGSGRTRRIGLGDVNALDPEKAREAARAHLGARLTGTRCG
jgi:hypothetical protein